MCTYVYVRSIKYILIFYVADQPVKADASSYISAEWFTHSDRYDEVKAFFSKWNKMAKSVRFIDQEVMSENDLSAAAESNVKLVLILYGAGLSLGVFDIAFTHSVKLTCFNCYHVYSGEKS